MATGRISQRSGSHALAALIEFDGALVPRNIYLQLGIDLAH